MGATLYMFWDGWSEEVVRGCVHLAISAETSVAITISPEASVEIKITEC